MKHLLLSSLLLLSSSFLPAHNTLPVSSMRASILQTEIAPFIQAEDCNQQVQSFADILVTTESELDEARFELSNYDSLLESTEEELVEAQSDIVSLQGELVTTESELDTTRTMLSDTESVLESTRDILSDTDSVLEETRTLFSNTESVLESTNEVLATVESELDTTRSTLSSTDSMLESTEDELSLCDSVVDQAEDLMYDSAIPGVADIDAIIASLFSLTPYNGQNPTSPLISQLNEGLIPYIQAALLKLGEIGIIKQIAVGLAHTIVLMNNGNIYGCGNNGNGQLGIGVSTGLMDSRTTLTAFHIPESGWNGIPTKVTAGNYHSLVLTNNGTIYGCGQNTYGQLGIGADISNQLTFTIMQTEALNSTPTNITAGSYHTIVLTDTCVFGCGYNLKGQLGIGDYLNNQLTLTAMHTESLNSYPTDITAGGSSSLVLTDNGEIYGCGNNNDGQLGVGVKGGTRSTLTSFHDPEEGWSGIPTKIASGPDFSLVLTDDGTIYGCGNNNGGKLGIDNEVDQTTLTAMHDPESGWSGIPRSISGGSYHTVVLTNNGTIYGCGWTDYGQLGIGTDNAPTYKSLTLTAMLEPTEGFNGTPQAVIAGNDVSFVLTDSGSIYGCGPNYTYQLGIGNNIDDQLTLTSMITNPMGELIVMSIYKRN